MPERSSRLLELPVEIQLKIMGYLGCRDLETLKRTSRKLQSIALHPSLWKEYEILDDKTAPSEIISNLKRMSLLKKIVIRNRIDTNNIVRQISLSNKHLEELQITYKHDESTMYLQAPLMRRLVERCQQLHTINLDGVYCRSLKFYRLLGKKVFGNLRSLNVKMTMGQIKAFVSHLNEQNRDNVYKSLRELGPRYWKVVRYLRLGDFRWIQKQNTH
ncbi:uncharacterized protein LOC131663572 [Phymastichus coffea]|uniref:uncharacterized protein LOC131663572 n=1 Tax=Phymastichus coffea TaxID=108790 RepID=UPI00273B8BA8|nr:uncharacterized protein LOC131663572 [Phymastichus coffea]